MKNITVFGKILTLALLAGLSVFFTLSLSTDTAEAQERRRTLFELLFGRRQPKSVRPMYPPSQRIIRPRTYRNQSAMPKAPAVPKSENAKRILVVGDFVAMAMAEGLTEAYNDNPEVTVIAKAEGSSGFVRNDYYNWPAKISTIITQEKPDIILVMVGANDRQAMKLDGKSVDSLTPPWISNYQSRILSFTTSLQKSGRPWVWLSLPSFKQPNLNQSIIVFNSYFKEATEKANGHFIDIWEGFVDDKGNFTLSGYDINGQTARLRSNDGINFTPPGRRKLAFYAEQAIQALLGNTGRAASPATEPIVHTLPNNIERVAPTGLWDTTGQDTGLAGATFAKPSDKTPKKPNAGFPQYRFHKGRADNFNMPEKN